MSGKNFSWLKRTQVGLAAVSLILVVIAFSIYPAGSAAVSAAQNLVEPGRNSSDAPIINSLVSGGKQTSPKAHGLSPKSHQNLPHKPKPMLALSFDDGPNPLTTPLILNTLEKEKVHASFFIVGSRVKGSESLLRRMYQDGDDIGNHSWSHPDFINLNEKQIASQINRTEKVIAEAGVPAPFMFRPPYGDMGSHFPKHLPLAIILWNIDPRDWADHDATSLTQRILSEARPGGIIDMHGIYLSTAQAIVPAVQQLKKHYQLVTVSQLLKIKPGTTGVFYGYR